MVLSEFLAQIKKEQTEDMYAEVRNGIAEGEINPLQMLVGIKLMVEMLGNLREFAMPLAVEELRKYGGKEVPMFGAILSIADTGVTWDFNVCNDSVWNEIKAEEAAYVQSRKSREEVLKLFQRDPMLTEYVNEETAELVERPLCPPIRRSTTIVKVESPKIKKGRKRGEEKE